MVTAFLQSFADVLGMDAPPSADQVAQVGLAVCPRGWTGLMGRALLGRLPRQGCVSDVCAQVGLRV